MTAKEQVLKVYPDAWCQRSQEFECYFIRIYKAWYLSPRLNSFSDTTEEQAWQSALTKINENGTRTIHTPCRNPSAEEA